MHWPQLSANTRQWWATGKAAVALSDGKTQKRLQQSSAKFSKVQQSSAKFGKVQQGSARFTRERDRKDEEIEEIEEIVILLSSCSNITRVVQQVSAERLSVELANPGSPDKSFQQKRLEAVNREFNKGSSHEFLCCNSPFCCISMDFHWPAEQTERGEHCGNVPNAPHGQP